MAEVRTLRWTRSPRGQIFGVIAGLGEWRGLSVDTLRLVVILIALFSAIAPVVIIYLLLALILPEQTRDDIIGCDEYRRGRQYNKSKRHASDAVYREKDNDDIEKEYDNLKRKVESMENDTLDKERDWDNRFNNN